MMAAYSIAALKADLSSGPLAQALAPLVAARDDAGVAAAYNDPAGPQAGPVALPSLSRDDFLKAMRPALLSLPGLASAVQAKWDRILGVARSSDSITVDATTRAMLGAAVADAVLTQAQADAAWHRQGSYAEVAWGAGTVVAVSDISAALNGA